MGTCDLRADCCCRLRTSGTSSPAHGCLPRGPGPLCRGCGDTVPARGALMCRQREPRGCRAFVPPALSFPPSDLFFSLCFQPAVCAALPLLSTHSSCLDSPSPLQISVPWASSPPCPAPPISIVSLNLFFSPSLAPSPCLPAAPSPAHSSPLPSRHLGSCSLTLRLPFS